MPRFSPTRFPPGFFDLPADAGHALPLDVIAAWTRSAQTPEIARELLRPYTIRGIVVSSDTAGLTRLTAERSLIEILAMVNRPKELVHAYGRAIGGIPLGVWAADNSQMFYPDGIPAPHVLSLLLTLMDKVTADCEVGIGLCVHHGVFYELGHGIYGPDADLVEKVAEDHVDGGEITVTRGLARQLGETGFSLSPRDDLRDAYGEILRVLDGPRLRNVLATDFRYPLPFSDEFYGGLHEFSRTRRSSVVPRPAYRDATIVVIEREREDPDVPEVAVLNDLALAAGVKRIGGSLVEDLAGIEVKTSSAVSIYSFDDARHAVDFSRTLRATLAAQRVRLRIGIDSGRVLLFDLAGGQHDLAGSPVNIASKLAQDAGQFDDIAITAAAARRAGLPDVVASRGLLVGGVTVETLTI